MKILYTILLGVLAHTSMAAPLIVKPCGLKQIVWDSFTSTPAYANRIIVEKWSSTELKWEQSEDFLSGIKGSFGGKAKAGNNRVQQGKVYRLLGCTDEEATDCETSKAVWSPWAACESERNQLNFGQINRDILFEDPILQKTTHLVVADFGSMKFQAESYNNHLAVVEVVSMGPDAPAMLRPDPVVAEEATELEWLQFNVFRFYEKYRTGEYPDMTGTGVERYFPD